MILVCGEALIDLFVGPAEGARCRPHAVAGGSPFNVAIGLARPGGGRVLPRRNLAAIVSARCWRAPSFARASTIASGSYRSAVDDLDVATDDNGQPELCFSRRVTGRPGRATVA